MLTPALNYINENYMRKIAVDELAEMCHLSTTHFPAAVFFSIMGSNPHNFINQTRITRACTMLQTTDQAILSIAETVGFTSVSSFNRCFQQMIGVTPRQYRSPDHNNLKPPAPPEHRAVPRLGSAGSVKQNGCLPYRQRRAVTASWSV